MERTAGVHTLINIRLDSWTYMHIRQHMRLHMYIPDRQRRAYTYGPLRYGRVNTAVLRHGRSNTTPKRLYPPAL